MLKLFQFILFTVIVKLHPCSYIVYSFVLLISLIKTLNQAKYLSKKITSDLQHAVKLGDQALSTEKKQLNYRKIIGAKINK